MIPLEGRNLRAVEKVASIQGAIAEELVDTAVKLVSASPGNCVDHATRSSSILRRIIARDYREFLDCIDSQIETYDATRCTIGIIVDADSVEAIVILLRSSASDRDLHAIAAIAAIGSDGYGFLCSDCRYSGLQDCELGPIASVEWKLADCLRVDHLADLRGCQLNISG